MQQVEFLKSAPKVKRNIASRFEAKDSNVIAIAKQYGELYFDGPRQFGYGGYYYDGRWSDVAYEIVKHFHLGPGATILDVGCAKGFLVKDLLDHPVQLEPFGIDISRYAIDNCLPDVIGRLHLGSADNLPFPDNSFNCVVSFNTIHNLPRDRAKKALSEIQRVSNGRAFVQVDSYMTKEQKALFEKWVLTAEFHGYPDDWFKLFKEAGYTGDYNWTIVEEG